MDNTNLLVYVSPAALQSGDRTAGEGRVDHYETVHVVMAITLLGHSDEELNGSCTVVF